MVVGLAVAGPVDQNEEAQQLPLRATLTKESATTERADVVPPLVRPESVSSSMTLPIAATEETKGRVQLETIRSDLKKKLSLGLTTPRLGTPKRSGAMGLQEERVRAAIHQRIAEAELGSFADLKGELEAKYDIKETIGEVRQNGRRT